MPTDAHHVRTVRIALIGVDIQGHAHGGMASVSLSIIEGFAESTSVTIVPMVNYVEGSVARRLGAAAQVAVDLVRNRRKIDVVHLQVADGLSIERDLLLAIVARSVGIPVVINFHGAGQEADFTDGSRAHKWTYRKLVHLGHNFVLGEKIRDWLLTVDPTAVVEILPNGVVVGAAPEPFPEDGPCLAFVGRVGHRKGTFDLLGASEELLKDGRSFRLEVLGDGDLEEAEQQVRQSELLTSHVTIHGWSDQAAVRRELIRAWALVLPSYAEGLPMAILEAMAVGRAVIATAVGDVESAVSDGVTGLLVEPGEREQLVAAIDRIVSGRDLSQSLGQEGFRRARAEFSLHAMLEKLESTYLRLMRSEDDPKRVNRTYC